MKQWLDKHIKIVFALPTLIFLLVMVVAPLLYNFGMSFTNWTMSAKKAPEFIALANYIEVFKEPRFIDAVGRTVVYSFIAIALEAILGVALAILINRKFGGRRIIQALMLLPVVATPVALGMAWKLILEPSIGVGNVLLTSMGFAARKFIATTSFESMLCLILIDVWEWTPLVMLMVYAGLVTIPQDPYESALIDGASRWQTLTKITLPLASQGGPNFATENINIYGYLNMFSYYEFGKASAISVLFFMVVMAIGCGFLYVKSKVEVDY